MNVEVNDAYKKVIKESSEDDEHSLFPDGDKWHEMVDFVKSKTKNEAKMLDIAVRKATKEFMSKNRGFNAQKAAHAMAESRDESGDSFMEQLEFDDIQEYVMFKQIL